MLIFSMVCCDNDALSFILKVYSKKFNWLINNCPIPSNEFFSKPYTDIGIVRSHWYGQTY